MTKTRYYFLMLFVLVSLIIGIILYKTYPYIEASYYNRDIDVNGVKLLQTESEFSQILNERGEFTYGMGGNGWRFKDKQIFVMTSSIGIFKDKVSVIETENPLHKILGIKVGDDCNEASLKLKNFGFKELSDGIYTRGNVLIQLTGQNQISRIRISIGDPAYKDVVF